MNRFMKMHCKKQLQTYVGLDDGADVGADEGALVFGTKFREMNELSELSCMDLKKLFMKNKYKLTDCKSNDLAPLTSIIHIASKGDLGTNISFSKVVGC